MLPLYEHQEAMAQFGLERKLVFNSSDPGTGKTRGSLEAYKRRREQLSGVGRLLVVAPLSILQSAWGDDIESFTEFRYSIAHGNESKRIAAFRANTDIVLINHDGVKWLDRQTQYLEGFTDLIVDESTAFKNRTSQRSKAMRRVASRFNHITALTGTPNPNSITDVWHQVYILDNGQRLGRRFFEFRSQVCVPEQVGPQPNHVRWLDKPGAGEVVSELLSDINIRYRFEDCIDIPEHVEHSLMVDMPAKVLKCYKEMEDDGVAITDDDGVVNAVHAGVRVQKMLQILSGAVYDTDGEVHPVDNGRYALVMQLVAERDHSVVAFNWSHQKEALCQLADKMGITYGVIDGSVSAKKRAEVVTEFQAGNLQVVFCHPQSAGHGELVSW